MNSPTPAKASPRALGGLRPFLTPYRGAIGLALLFLLLAAGATLVFPQALRSLIAGGLLPAHRDQQALALGPYCGALFGVAVALAVFSAARFYTVSWLGERCSAALTAALY